MFLPKETAATGPALLKALPYPLYLAQRDGAIHPANVAAEELNGRLGLAGAMPAPVGRHLEEAMTKNQDATDGDLRRTVPLADQAYLPQIFRLATEGGPETWAVLLVEVTRLRETMDARARTLSTLSHEVKTPLTGIRLSLHLLLEEKLGALNSAQRELLEVGRDECERMLLTLQTQLELARFENGRIELQLQPVSPVELLSAAASAQGPVVQGAGSELRTETPVDLPNVMADLRMTNHVLGHLVANAAKHGAKGRPVALRAGASGAGLVRFSVAVQGPALSEAERRQAFDPLSRRPYADTVGPDLHLCREIISQHGGRMGVECPAGTGLVEFFFELRRAD